jgi:hypothetical protein
MLSLSSESEMRPLHVLHDIAPPFETLPTARLQRTLFPENTLLEIVVRTKVAEVFMELVAKKKAPP